MKTFADPVHTYSAVERESSALPADRRLWRTRRA